MIFIYHIVQKKSVTIWCGKIPHELIEVTNYFAGFSSYLWNKTNPARRRPVLEAETQNHFDAYSTTNWKFILTVENKFYQSIVGNMYILWSKF